MFVNWVYLAGISVNGINKTVSIHFKYCNSRCRDCIIFQFLLHRHFKHADRLLT